MTVELLREEMINELKTIYTEKDLDRLTEYLLKVIIYPTDRPELSGIEDGQYSEEFNLSSSVVSKHFEVDLKNSDSLKIEIASIHGSKYGFFNVIFVY